MTAPAVKVLIADDSPLVLRMLEKMLGAAGFGVVVAHDGLWRANACRYRRGEQYLIHKWYARR